MNIKKSVLLTVVGLSLTGKIKSGTEHEVRKSPEEQVLHAHWFEAASAGDINTLKKLVNKININARDYYGSTALICATERWQQGAVEFLLTIPEININAQNKFDESALLVAAINNSRNIVTLLLAMPGINVNAQNKHRNSPLICAINSLNLESVKQLLKMPGLNINAQNTSGCTALTKAVVVSSQEIVKLLLEMPEINIVLKNRQGKTALILAQELHNVTITKLIQDKINVLSGHAFDAITNRNIDKLQAITDQIGIDNIKDESGNTLLDKACSAHAPEIMEFLLQKAENAQELLARFPFEFINPTSDLFKYFMDLAYGAAKIIDCASPSKKRKQDELSQNSCARCLKAGCETRCSTCKKVYYCGPECQKANWKAHKVQCKPA